MLTVAISKRNKLQNIIVLTPKDGKVDRKGYGYYSGKYGKYGKYYGTIEEKK